MKKKKIPPVDAKSSFRFSSSHASPIPAVFVVPGAEFWFGVAVNHYGTVIPVVRPLSVSEAVFSIGLAMFTGRLQYKH